MPTDRQTSFYMNLCEQLGQEPDDDFESLTVAEARRTIDELKDILDNLEGDK